MPEDLTVDRQPRAFAAIADRPHSLVVAVAFAGLAACARSPGSLGPPVPLDTPPALAPDASLVTRWIADHAITPATLEPGGDLADLRRFETMVGDARIVGLGEANHGAHEIFALKRRLFELLVV